MSNVTLEESRADREYLGLEMAGSRGRATVTSRLETPMGTLHGGAALGLAIAAMESVTGRCAVWATGQFVGVARHDDRLTIEVHELAIGRSSSQLHVVATGESGLVFQAMGATGSGRNDMVDRSFVTMPEVDGAEAYAVGGVPVAPDLRDRGHFLDVEYRHTGLHDGMCMWVRVREHVVSRPAVLAIVADYLPLSIMLESDTPHGGGSSLDNTLRFIRRVECDWVLVDCRASAIERGYGHGTVHVWSPDGQLVAFGSQTSMQRPVQHLRSGRS